MSRRRPAMAVAGEPVNLGIGFWATRVLNSHPDWPDQ